MTFTITELDGFMADLAMLRFFPTDPNTQSAIKAYLAKICPHREALVWLIQTLTNSVGEWPGPAEVRRILARRWAPADGNEGISLAETSEPDYIDWQTFPDHRAERALPPRENKLLPAGGELLPDRPPAEVFGEVLNHFGKPWPRGTASAGGEIRELEERLEREKAATPPLTENQKRSRILAIESALGKPAK